MASVAFQLCYQICRFRGRNELMISLKAIDLMCHYSVHPIDSAGARRIV
jgi:hypothetical protein